MKSLFLFGMLSMIATPRDPFFQVGYRIHNATQHWLTVDVTWQPSMSLKPQTFSLPPRSIRVIYEEGQHVPEYPYHLIRAFVFRPVCETGASPYEIENVVEADWQEEINDFNAHYTLVLESRQVEAMWGGHVITLTLPDRDL